MRFALLIGLALLVVAGCGSDASEPAAPRDAADIVRANHAKEAVWMQRVLGDDPISESVSLRVNGTVAVRRGGGRGYWDVAMELDPQEADRALQLVKRAPFAALADNTIEPGGFGGNDNGVRYWLRRGNQTVTIAGADLPPAMRRLVNELNALIEGDRGRIVADDRHFSASGVTGELAKEKGATAPDLDDTTTATPLVGVDGAPRPQITLSCYGHGDREATGAAPSAPVTFTGLNEARTARVTDATAVVQPGASATVSIAPKDRHRAGLLYGRRWSGPHSLAASLHTIRFEGCSDVTAGGGPARFEGGLVATGKGCVTLLVSMTGRDRPERRRVACHR